MSKLRGPGRRDQVRGNERFNMRTVGVRVFASSSAALARTRRDLATNYAWNEVTNWALCFDENRSSVEHVPGVFFPFSDLLKKWPFGAIVRLAGASQRVSLGDIYPSRRDRAVAADRT